jgi:hypothetical protein
VAIHPHQEGGAFSTPVGKLFFWLHTTPFALSPVNHLWDNPCFTGDPTLSLTHPQERGRMVHYFKKPFLINALCNCGTKRNHYLTPENHTNAIGS